MSFRNRQNKGSSRPKPTHRRVLILQHPKHVFHHDIVLNPDKLRHFLRDPWSQHGEVDLSQIDLGDVSIDLEFQRFHTVGWNRIG